MVWLLVFVVVFIVVWCWSYERLSVFTRQKGPDEGILLNKNEYYSRVKEGSIEAAENGVLICGLIRDGKDRLSAIKQHCYQIAEPFRRYNILIVENDSKDGTRASLLKWSRSDPNVKILGCGVNVESCQMGLSFDRNHTNSESRFTKMARLRNLYLKCAKDHYSLSGYRYMVVWDLDIDGWTYTAGLLNSLGFIREQRRLGREVRSVCAYGIKLSSALSSYYYDTVAHVDHDRDRDRGINTQRDRDVSEGPGKGRDNKRMRDLRIRGNMSFYKRGSHPVPVKSCFGGLVIYDRKGLGGLMHSVPSSECEHLSLQAKLLDRDSTGSFAPQSYVNPSMAYYILSN